MDSVASNAGVTAKRVPPMISCPPMLPSRLLRALSVFAFLGTLLGSSLALAQTSDMERLIYNLAITAAAINSF